MLTMEKSGGLAAAAAGKLKSSAEPPQQEHLPCPRCHSSNTKFCYYNNYNFSQPRHFCKGCRRYWTHGGTLRDIPIGGGSRKGAKRCRTSSSYTTSASGLIASSSGSGSTSSHDFLNSTPVFLPAAAAYGGVGGSGFTSLLTGSHGPGMWALGGGFGLGLGSGLAEDIGFGLGKGGGWPFGDVGIAGGGGGLAVGGGGNGDAWQMENVNNNNSVGLGAAGEYFGWPELAISTPGNGLK